MVKQAHLEVCLIFAALFTWAVLLAFGVKRGSYGPFLAFGVAFATTLNLRHLLVSTADAFSLVVGVYDVLGNLGRSDDDIDDSHSQTTPSSLGLVPCPTSSANCTVWGEDVYGLHPAWSVRFYERFVHGPTAKIRNKLLLVHNLCNATAFLILHVQIMRPGNSKKFAWQHKLLGRLSLISLTIGLFSALQLANEHVDVDEYGNTWSKWGFYEMALCCYAPAVMGVYRVRSGDWMGHRTWMWRYAGAMWGSFWIFRVGLLLVDPFFQNRKHIAWLLATWLSAPLGISVAEMVRRRIDGNKQGSEPKRRTGQQQQQQHRVDKPKIS